MRPKFVVNEESFRKVIRDPSNPGMRELIRFMARVAVDEYLAELRGEHPQPSTDQQNREQHKILSKNKKQKRALKDSITS